eukprot:13225883-Alexandrium_andersonii.AAC.1
MLWARGGRSSVSECGAGRAARIRNDGGLRRQMAASRCSCRSRAVPGLLRLRAPAAPRAAAPSP